jgi:hypothetical protein
VRSLLTERGVGLPPQNDPPPLAKKRDRFAELDPATAYWLEWLRPVLMIGVVLGAVELLTGLWSLWFHVAYFSELPSPGVLVSDLASLSVLALAAKLFLSLSLLIGIVLALRLRPAGRKFLFAYCFASFAWTAVLLRNSVHAALADGAVETWYGQVEMWVWYLYGLAYPLILLLFLRRREIKLLFHPALMAFEVKQEPAPAYHSSPQGVRVHSPSLADSPATKES